MWKRIARTKAWKPLLSFALSTNLIALAWVASIAAQTPAPALQRTEILSYEGQNVSSVELAGRPDLKPGELMTLVTQRSGEPFSPSRIDETITGLKRTGLFEDVHIDLRPDAEGVRVLFVLHPAVYFGVYQFPGAERFPYSRLLQISNYVSPEPYSYVDVQNARSSLETFFRRNGFFQSEIHPDIVLDEANGLVDVHFRTKLKSPARFGEVLITGPSPEEVDRLERSLRSLRARLFGGSIRTGKKYSLNTLQEATNRLESALTKEKRLAAKILVVGADYNPATNRADIHFNAVPGPRVNVKVEGAHLWPWTKHRLLPMYQENGLTPELIQEGRQNLISHFTSKGYFDVRVKAESAPNVGVEDITYRIEKGPRKKIEDVEFVGNEHLSEDELEQHVLVNKAGFLSRGKYDERSAKMLTGHYQAAGFNEVRVRPQFATHNDKVVVTFVIEEGPRDTVASFQIAGNQRLPLTQLAPDGLRLGPGQPYSQKNIDDDRNKIMTHYFEAGYLTAAFRVDSQPLPGDPHKFNVVYSITEGPQVHANSIVTLGRQRTQQALIDKGANELRAGRPLKESEILMSESRLYTTGVFDWAQINPRRQITSQDKEDVIIRVHESRRNSLRYGFGLEMVNRGGSVPTGTVAAPGLPPVGLPSTFKTSQRSFFGPRANFQYTRTNVRGKAETITVGVLAAPLNRRATFSYTNPNLRWTNWTSNLTVLGEHNKENPIFTSREGQAGVQLQRPLGKDNTRNLFARYAYTETRLTHLVIPELVPLEDLHTRLSTISGTYTRDTRDNILDARKGNYLSIQVDLNPRLLGSDVSFAKAVSQAAYYQDIHSGIIWANSLRVGLEQALAGSRVPLSQKFFTGGGSTLRGFPLNGAGPQSTIPACVDPGDPSTCALIRVPRGGVQLIILNSEFRIPMPMKKGLGLVAFYDGGNVYEKIGFQDFFSNYTNSAGLGIRYATPVGPVRMDIGRNLNKISGIKATQIFITLGQAF